MEKILEFIKKNYPIISILVIVILGIFLLQSYSTLKHERKEREYEKKQYEQNQQALVDSITVVFNKKLSAWEYSKDNFLVQKLDDLEKYNKQLTDELKKVKGDVIAAIKTEVQGDLGGISTSSNLEVLDAKNNHYGLAFKSDYKDSGFEQKLEGISKFYVIPNEKDRTWNIKPDSTVFSVNSTTVKLTYGFRELSDKYQVFAISNSDKIKITDLTGGYFINKQPAPQPVKKKKWGIGPYIGYGVNLNNNGTFGFGASLGLGLHYNILQW